MVSGTWFDAYWQNVLIGADGDHVIDEEWIYQKPFSPTWLIYRTVEKFFDDELHFSRRSHRPFRLLTVHKVAASVH